jgi:hypothetical protein
VRAVAAAAAPLLGQQQPLPSPPPPPPDTFFRFALVALVWLLEPPALDMHIRIIEPRACCEFWM